MLLLPKRGATIAPAELRFDPIPKVFSAPENYILTRDQGLSQTEIARKVGVSEEAVSWRVKRLKAKQASQVGAELGMAKLTPEERREQKALTNDPEFTKVPGVLDEIQAEIEEINKKTDPLSPQELKFIEYHLRIGLDIKKSMKKAGYRGLKPGKLYYTAIKIVEKYERRAEDHRKIMRLLGAGEVFVIQNQKELAKNSTSEVARQAANATLGKWLGMSGELSQSTQGITVIIQALDSAQQVNIKAPGPPASPTSPSYNHPQPARPGEPIQIYK